MTTSQALSDDALSFVCTLVKDRAAIELENSKSYLIEARLAPLARRRGYGSAAELIQVVRKQASMRLADEVVEAMTTNETSFFRDMHPFDALKKTFLPQLIGDGGRRRLRIWSAACSSGQELYSIAILIREHFPELLQWDLELLGTDICDEVLNKAKQGRYPQVEVNRGMPASLLVKYFERQGMNWGLRPEIRQMAQFRKMNLIRAWPITGKIDIVFLRNVLIYFAPAVKARILDNIRRLLSPNGVLFLGAAETTINLHDGFQRVDVEGTACYRLK